MPVKLRTAKRRITIEAEIFAWSAMFGSGWDFFGDAARLTGLREPVHVPYPDERAEAQRLWIAAAQEAWQRLGERFLETFEEDRVPWAVTQFGRPWETNNAG